MQQEFLSEFPDVYREVGALIGAARTVSQAERLVSRKWQEVLTKYPKLIDHPDIEFLLKWRENGSDGHPATAVPNLRNILLSSVQQ